MNTSTLLVDATWTELHRVVTVVNPCSRDGDGGAPDTCAPGGESERAGSDVVDAGFKDL